MFLEVEDAHKDETEPSFQEEVFQLVFFFVVCSVDAAKKTFSSRHFLMFQLSKGFGVATAGGLVPRQDEENFRNTNGPSLLVSLSR